MSRVEIDPQSPVPLYHQIAEHIRARIEAGELAPGETLQPLRIAAERWGVHLHTVRHAYAALARDGVLEISRGALGTRVASGATTSRTRKPIRSKHAGGPEFTDFLQRIMHESESRFGITRSALAASLQTEAAGEPGNPVVYVTECSEHQCAAHAREITERYGVDVRPWPLDRGEPPAGPVIATYFHYNDIRRSWPRRLGGIRFITIRPHEAVRERLRRQSGVVQVCERDIETAEAVIGDVYALLGPARIKLVAAVTNDPAALLRGRTNAPVLFPPRVWAQLDERARRHPRAVELAYALDEAELDRFALESGWAPRGLSAAS